MIYVHYGVAMICLGEGILLLMASYAEHHIAFQEKELKKMSFSFSGYREEMMEGFHYLKKEKGIRSIYAYMSVTNANAEAVNMMSMALFQSSSVLTTTMYAFLTTAETAGRMLGSIFHYFVRIPDHVRYKIAVSVYASYEAMDMILLFIAYPLMILNRFICGFLGVNSMNIREASTQNYIPSHMRARVNGLSLIHIFSIGGTKNGALLGEAVVIVNEQLKRDFRYMIKQRGGMLAKGWLLGLQFLSLFEDDQYRKIAAHANAMAQKLQKAFVDCGYSLFAKSSTNQIFVILPNEVIKKLEKQYAFQFWEKVDATHTAMRFVTSWATPEAVIDEFITYLKQI